MTRESRRTAGFPEAPPPSETGPNPERRIELLETAMDHELGPAFEHIETLVDSLSSAALLPHLTPSDRWEHLADLLLGHLSVRGGARPRDYPIGGLRRASSDLACRIATLPRVREQPRPADGSNPKQAMPAWFRKGSRLPNDRAFADVPIELGPWLVALRLGWLSVRDDLERVQQEALALRLIGLTSCAVVESLVAQEESAFRGSLDAANLDRESTTELVGERHRLDAQRRSTRWLWMLRLLGLGSEDRRRAGVIGSTARLDVGMGDRGDDARQTAGHMHRLDRAASFAAIAARALSDALHKAPSPTRRELLRAKDAEERLARLVSLGESSAGSAKKGRGGRPGQRGPRGQARAVQEPPPRKPSAQDEAESTKTRLVVLKTVGIGALMRRAESHSIERGVSAFASQTLSRLRDHLCGPHHGLGRMAVVSDTEAVVVLAAVPGPLPRAEFERRLEAEIIRLLRDQVPESRLASTYPRLQRALEQALDEGWSVRGLHADLSASVLDSDLLELALDCGEYAEPTGNDHEPAPPEPDPWGTASAREIVVSNAGARSGLAKPPDDSSVDDPARCSGLVGDPAFQNAEFAIPAWFFRENAEKGESYGAAATVYSLAGTGFRVTTAQGLIEEVRAGSEGRRWLQAQAKERARLEQVHAELGWPEPDASRGSRFVVRADGNAVGRLFVETPRLLRPALSLMVEAELRRRLTRAVVELVCHDDLKSLQTLPIDLHYLGGDDVQLSIPGGLLERFLDLLTREAADPNEHPLRTPTCLSGLSFKLGAVELPAPASQAEKQREFAAREARRIRLGATHREPGPQPAHRWARDAAGALMRIAADRPEWKVRQAERELFQARWLAERATPAVLWESRAEVRVVPAGRAGGWQIAILRLVRPVDDGADEPAQPGHAETASS
jgi:hypothetical protein